MKPITLHPGSALVGALVVAFSVVLSAAAQRTGPVRHLPDTTERVLGEIPADRWTFVRVESIFTNGAVLNRSYTVPSDRHFVVTDHRSNFNFGTGLLVNGSPSPDTNEALSAITLGTANHGARVVFAPGTTLSYPDAAPGAFAWFSFWGYLEPL